MTTRIVANKKILRDPDRRSSLLYILDSMAGIIYDQKRICSIIFEKFAYLRMNSCRRLLSRNQPPLNFVVVRFLEDGTKLPDLAIHKEIIILPGKHENIRLLINLSMPALRPSGPGFINSILETFCNRMDTGRLF